MLPVLRITKTFVAWFSLVSIIVTGFASSVSAGGAPFTNVTPAGFTWWKNGQSGTNILLASNAPLGVQSKFFIVEPGDKADSYLVAWMGGGEIVWQGGVKAGGLEWQAKLAKGGGRRGLIATSSDRQWTFAAIAPEGEWAQVAGFYNSILKGAK
jgi:hypothetical protein